MQAATIDTIVETIRTRIVDAERSARRNATLNEALARENAELRARLEQYEQGVTLELRLDP